MGGGQVEPRVSWSVRTAHEENSARQLESLERFVVDLCEDRFPADEGYSRCHARLSGPIEGVTTTIARGDFRALVSVQRYVRDLGRSHTASEVRLIACAGSQRIADGERKAANVASRTLMAGLALAALVAVGLAWSLGTLIAGATQWMIPFAWHGPLLALPSILTGMLLSTGAVSMGRSRGQQALCAAHSAASRDRDLQADMAHWVGVLQLLEIQQELVSQQTNLPPFRNAAGSRWSDLT